MKKPLVSIVVPTYNEEKDIGNVLDNLLKLKYKNKEIIIVDGASKDRTVSIIKEKGKKTPEIKLLESKKREGVSLARNRGIKNARGSIVIILNADVILPPDFIQKILPHYGRGADFVLVNAEIINKGHVFPRWVEAQHHYLYDNAKWIVWTEGFSCRKKAAIDAGLFPFLGRSAGGEDAIFGNNLEKRGWKKIIDNSVFVRHYAPEDMGGAWKHRNIRGKGTFFIMKYYNKRGWPYLIANLLKHSLYSIFYLFTLIIPFVQALRVTRFSPRGLKDIVPFMAIFMFDRIAKIAGAWQAFIEILRSSKKSKVIKKQY